MKQQFPVVAINDLYENWKGTVRLRLLRDGAPLTDTRQTCEIPALGDVTLKFMVELPEEGGNYQLEAALYADDNVPVRSLRDFNVKP